MQWGRQARVKKTQTKTQTTTTKSSKEWTQHYLPAITAAPFSHPVFCHCLPSEGSPFPRVPGEEPCGGSRQRGRGGDTAELPGENPHPRFRNFLQNSCVRSIFASFFHPVLSPFAPMQRSHLLCCAFPTIPGVCPCKSWLCQSTLMPFGD